MNGFADSGPGGCDPLQRPLPAEGDQRFEQRRADRPAGDRDANRGLSFGQAQTVLLGDRLRDGVKDCLLYTSPSPRDS